MSAGGNPSAGSCGDFADLFRRGWAEGTVVEAGRILGAFDADFHLRLFGLQADERAVALGKRSRVLTVSQQPDQTGAGQQSPNEHRRGLLDVFAEEQNRGAAKD